jgi:hypothetical protein
MPRGAVPRWCDHAGWQPGTTGQPAEHAHAADRCAREIVGILTVSVVRSRRLMGRPFGTRGSVVGRLFLLVIRRDS